MYVLGSNKIYISVVENCHQSEHWNEVIRASKHCVHNEKYTTMIASRM